MMHNMKFTQEGSQSYLEHLVKLLHKQQQQGDMNLDFKLQSGEKSVLVHSQVLSNCSSLLSSILQSPCPCSQPTILLLHHTYASILPNIVALLYTGSSGNIDQTDNSILQSLLKELGFQNVASISSHFTPNNDFFGTITPSLISKQSNKTRNILKAVTAMQTGQQKFSLSLPKSRTTQIPTNPVNTVILSGYYGRVQQEYNTCPVGPYAGPYDQNEKLKLSVQLPKSDLDYKNYSEFEHEGAVGCKEFTIGNNYLELDDLEKIDSYTVKSNKGSENDDEKSYDEDDDKVVYTCKTKKCIIPCPCELCALEEKQCTQHQIKHPKLFDETNHAICIRSSEESCKDETFSETSYINRYAGILNSYHQCLKDLLHHKSYHIDFHHTCKFCKQNWYKLFPESEAEFQEKQDKEDQYLCTVCPFCDKKFCEPYFAKKHIQFSHEGKVPHICEICESPFQSKQGLEYHLAKSHSASISQEICDICEKVFTSNVSLTNHMKYVHSDNRKFSCKDCDAKFKQKKSLKSHNLHVHAINQFKKQYQKSEEEIKFKCKLCRSSYQQKKDLNHHIRIKHENNASEHDFMCDLCHLSFKEKKSLNAHVKLKHKEDVKYHSCPKCAKTFNRKSNMNKHLQRQEYD